MSSCVLDKATVAVRFCVCGNKAMGAIISTVRNIIWFILGGFVLTLQWFGVGCLLAATVVGIPLATAAWRMAVFAACPFDRHLVDERVVGDAHQPGGGLANFMWIMLAGVWLALEHCLIGAAFCCTIIGIPFGLAHFELARACFAPLDKYIVHNQANNEVMRHCVTAPVNAPLAWGYELQWLITDPARP